MASHLLLLIFRILFAHVAIRVCVYGQLCYHCMGPDCDPKTSEVMECDTGMCFLMTVEVINTYRGCFKSGNPLTKECKENRFSSCLVCKGNLCNSQDAINEGYVISCLKCSKGICGPNLKMQGFRRCPLFRTPELPRCYSIVDRYTNEYTFGCANEMTMEQSRMCERDYFKSVCQFCDTPNCNVEFFRGSEPRSLLCYSNSGWIYCATNNNQFPYYGCYTKGLGMNQTFTKGCLSDLYESPTDPNYQALFDGTSANSSIVVCFTDKCNEYKDTEHWPGLTVCGNVYCGTTHDDGALCAQYQWDTENGVHEIREQCMGRYPCWRAEECKSPCMYEGNETGVLGQSCVNPNMNCYVCSNCPTVNNDSPYLRRSCEQRITSCVTLVKDGAIYRGCNQGDIVDICSQVGDESCETCRSPGCNSRSYHLFCHQCTALNPMCTYSQQDTLAVPCDAGVIVTLQDGNDRCHATKKMDGQVVRGCMNSRDGCPDGVAACVTCQGNFCNAGSYLHANCIKCSGNFTEKCAVDSVYLASKQATGRCELAYETPHCYMSIRQNEVHRGCVADKHYYEVLQYTCNDKESCMFCDGENCNYFAIDLKAMKSNEVKAGGGDQMGKRNGWF